VVTIPVCPDLPKSARMLCKRGNGERVQQPSNPILPLSHILWLNHQLNERYVQR